jgi:hypothetical protein
VESAAALPGAWDVMAEHYFQRRAFLAHCERYNPCRQRYYLCAGNSQPAAGAVVYTLRLDLLTFARIPSPLTMHIIGVPCSVSPSGVVGDPASFGALLAGVFRQERGLVICLNLDRSPGVPGAVPARTLPSVVFRDTFPDWGSYVRALRSPYRRRLGAALREAARLNIRSGPCAEFSPEHHALYEQVLSRSVGRLERLTLGFFRNLPSAFRLATFQDNGRILGWTIALRDGNHRAFFMGGRDYAAPAGRPLYFAMLAVLLRDAIAEGTRSLDLGQTAEVPKLRLGGKLQEKTMLGRHSSPVLRGVLHLGRGLLSYRRRVPAAHVFRRDN